MNKINLDGFWLPRQSSTFAVHYDHAWTIVTWMCAFLFFVVFLAVSIRAFGTNRAALEHAAHLPLEDDSPPIDIHTSSAPRERNT